MSLFNTIWDVIWTFFWIFAFIAYLIALFSVVTDLFRDTKLSGWAKALWLVALFFLPFLTALIYLIARGDGMAQRSGAVAKQNKERTEEYIRDVAGTSPADEIAKAKALLDAGTISETEFAQLKAAALSR
ncbi:MAG: SHOCT domain-containing protein [Tessaracoccus sp.]|uniref:SHOCT domain-containing protein n=1 Tax=Tessaracoccus sp. TaxID=1971211 RepID=UPI001EC7A6BF|nr:SHOCT domain-containing protein [Tessaracoccus sp.]MBK7821983.1 SHOCT domain-containing protein [Tessaracoccus sp.]